MSILVAGVGNIFLGDDGFGVEVARRLAERPLPPEVKVVDFGIRGFDFSYALLEGYEVIILVDAAKRGFSPGTVYVTEEGDATGEALPQSHSMTPARAIEVARTLGAVSTTFRVVSCEPATFGPEGLGCIGLSGPVALAVDQAIAAVESLIQEFSHQSCTNLP